MSSEQHSPAPSNAAGSAQDEEEVKLVREAVAEFSERINLRCSLLEANLKAVRERGAADEDDRFAGRDASLKKNTAFVKKLRAFTEKQKDDILKELAHLNLSRYISEAAQAITEAKFKMSDVHAMLTVCSSLHREYAEFSTALLHEYVKMLQASATFSGSSSSTANITRLRVDVRIFAELIVVGIFVGPNEKEALSTLSNVLTNCVNYAKTDAEQDGACAQSIAPAIVNLLRFCGDDLLGYVSQRQLTLAAKFDLSMPRATYSRFSAISQAQTDASNAAAGTAASNPVVRHLTAISESFRSFYTTLCACASQMYRRMRTLERSNARLLETHGELAADKQAALDAARTSYTKVCANLTTLADYLNLPVPELLAIDDEPSRPASSNVVGVGVSPVRNDTSAATTGGGDILMENLFEDDDTRQFYTKLPDLRCLLPSKEKDAPKKEEKTAEDTSAKTVSIEEVEREIEIEIEQQAQSASADNEALNSTEMAAEIADESGEAGEGAGSKADSSDKVQDSDKQAALAAASRSIKAQFDSFLEMLPRCVNRDLIDRAASEFLTCYNSKPNRRRLVSTLFAAPRTRYDLLAFYSRLAALLSQCYAAEIGAPLCAQLASELRWHVRKKDQTNIEAKLKTARFIGELIKFSVFDAQDALKLVSMLLADFTHHNIDMLSALLESAGRYLCRLPSTRQRARVLMQVVQRKTDNKRATLDAKYPPLVESAIATALKDIDEDLAHASGTGTPRSASAPRDEGPVNLPIEFARQLLVVDLATGRLDAEKVLRCLRRLNWDDAELRLGLTRIFSDASAFRYPALDKVACVLQGIASYYQDVAVPVVDHVIEDIRFGMQSVDPRLHQRRVAFARYFAELYNYRLIDSTVVFKVLYSLITFGVQFDDRVRTGIPKVDEKEAQSSDPQPPIVYADAMSLDPVDHLLRIRLICVILDACGTYFNQGKFAEKLDCFLIYFQRYCWYKRVHPFWNASSESNFPIEYIYTYTELFEKLRPKWRHAKSYDVACREVEKLEASLAEKIALALRNAEEQKANSGLAAIGEDENESDGDHEEANAFEPTRGDHDDQGDSDTATLTQSDSEEEPAEFDGPVDATEPLDEEAALRSLEDLAFASELERAISDSMQTRLSEVRNLQSTEIPLPISSKDSRDTTAKSPETVQSSENAVKFTVMMRKPTNKQQPQLATISIPADSQLAAQFLRNEQRERYEKEQLKKAVLGIHERQKAEEQFEDQRRSQATSFDSGDRYRRY